MFKIILNLAFCVILLCALTMHAHPSRAGSLIKASPFFLIGDGVVTIIAPRTHPVTVRFAHADATLDDAAFLQIDRIFDFPTREKGENVSRRMIAMLDYFSDLVAPGKPVHLKSGYRSPSSNDALRRAGKTAAKTSTHIDGMAIDFSLPGVGGKSLWELMRKMDCCGVGNYGGNVVHLDSSRPRFWEKATSKVHTNASDFNRTIYLSTEYDRVSQSARVRLFFTSVSDFGFGIRRRISYVTDREGEKTLATGTVDALGREMRETRNECILIQDRLDSRFLYTDLPANLGVGKRVRVKIDFCNRPFVEMPEQTVSNEIEIAQ